MPWSPPAIPPATADLRAALQILEADAAPATPKHVAWCLAKLMMAFEPATKLSGEETKLRAAVWLEACGDLGDSLWSTATLAAIQSSKWMPKPAEFRALVGRQIEDRARKIDRCKIMLSGQVERVDPKSPKPFTPEPEAVRIRAMRDSFRRIGKVWKAAQYETRLAGIEDREVEDWAIDVASEAPAEPAASVPSLPPVSADLQAGALIAASRRYRAQGRAATADRLDRDARALAPHLFASSPEHRDIPEAAA